MAIRRTLVAALTVLLAVTGVGLGSADGAELTDQEDATAVDRSNIVVVLIDDMSANLLQYMNETSALAESSVTFENVTMSNPLCCPSRATIQTGKYPHNSEVRSNWWPVGGFGQFLDNDLETSLGPYLDDAGYRTSLMGKFMNEYVPAGDEDGTGSPDYPSAFVPSRLGRVVRRRQRLRPVRVQGGGRARRHVRDRGVRGCRREQLPHRRAGRRGRELHLARERRRRPLLSHGRAVRGAQRAGVGRPAGA